MTILDSDVWIAYLNTKDSQHKKAQGVFSRMEKDATIIVVPEYVVLEVVTVLRRAVNERTASSFMGVLVGSRQVQMLCSDTKTFKAVSAYVYQKRFPKLSFTDLALLHLMTEYEVVSFDRALNSVIKKLA